MATQNSDWLCKLCQGMFKTRKNLTDLRFNGYTHHSLNGLKKAARKGCNLCAILKEHTPPEERKSRWRLFVIEDTYREKDEVPKCNCKSPRDGMNSFADGKSDGDDDLNVAFESDGKENYFRDSEAIFKSDPDLHPSKCNIQILLAIITLEATRGNSYKTTRSVEFLVIADLDDPAASYAEGRPFTTNLREPRAFEQAREWLHNCQDKCRRCELCQICVGTPRNGCKCKDCECCSTCQACGICSCSIICYPCHLGCQNANPVLPRRVLSVKKDNLQLYEPRNGETSRYAALSYCWGKRVQSYQTTEGSLTAGKELIRIEELEKSIQDAITCVRELGINYLWVDSLCIMQDNYEDKKITIMDLKNIFYNATVTIIAEDAETVSHGFLGDRQTSPICQLPFYCLSSGLVGSVTLMPTVKLKKDYVWPRLVRSGTRDRAWCLEEYLLSPRKLIYGEFDFRWSCQAPPYKPHYPKDVDRRGDASIASWDSVFSDYKTETQKVTRWLRIVQEYSLRNLTESEDKSRAIAGIGEKLAEMSGRRYIENCGILTNNQSSAELRGEILSWVVDKEAKGVVPGFPSWSWLSVKHGHFRHFQQVDPFDSIFRVEIDSEVDGVLRVNAALVPVAGLRGNLHVISDTNAPDTYQDCSLLCFNYFCHSEYVGLVIRPKRGQNCSRNEEQKWVRVGWFGVSENPDDNESVSVDLRDSYSDPPSSNEDPFEVMHYYKTHTHFLGEARIAKTKNYTLAKSILLA